MRSKRPSSPGGEQMARKNSQLLAFRVGGACSSGCRRRSDDYFTARDYGQLSSKYDAFAGRDTAGGDDVIALALTERNGTQFGCVVVVNHVDEWALLADLRGFVWNQHGVGLGREN